MSAQKSLRLLMQLARDVRDRFDCLDENEAGEEEHTYSQSHGDGTEGCLHCQAAEALAEMQRR